MVGHTGNIEATVKAIEAVDECIGKIFKQCKKNGYSLILTSDHGNAENMFDEKKYSMYNSFSKLGSFYYL